MKNFIFIFLFVGLLVRSYSQGVGVGSMIFTPDTSAMLEVRATNKGILIPRMTSAQRDAIINPAHSLLIFNTTTNCLEFRNTPSNQWIVIMCACSSVPTTPLANAATSITETSFVANWTASSGATMYYLDVATNSAFTAFVPGYNNLNVGNVTSYSVTGLTCNTQYFYRIRAVNSCGTSSNSNTINVTTTGCFTCFSRQLGGTNHDIGFSIIRTTTNKYVISGETRSFGSGNSDFWVLQLNSNFAIEWQRAYGGANEDYGRAIIQASDGDYVVYGWTTSFGAGQEDNWILKLNPDGTIEWQRTYGGANNDRASSLIQTSDGGFAVTGYTSSFDPWIADVWVFKLASDGTIQWQRRYGGTNYEDHGRAIIQTSDGNLVVASMCSSYGSGGYDIWLLKLSAANGSIIWQKTYGGTGDERGIHSLIQTSDGGLALVAWTNSFGMLGQPFADYDFWILKLDSDGNIQWQRTYGGAKDDWPYQIIQTTDGGYAVVGYTRSFGNGSSDVWVLKLASNGIIQWQRTYGGLEDDIGYSIVQSSDGGYVIVGQTNSFSGNGRHDFWILKLDNNGRGPECGNISTALHLNSTAIGQISTGAINAINLTTQITNAPATATTCTTTNGCPCP